MSVPLIPGIVNGGVVLDGPASDGTAGQALTTNGSGVLAFSSFATTGYVDAEIAEAVDGLATVGYVDASISSAVSGLASVAYVNAAVAGVTLASLGAAAAPATPGTVEALKANVPDANKDLHSLRRASVTERFGVGTNNPAIDLHLFNATVDSNVLVRVQNDARIWQFGVFGTSINDAFAIRDQTASVNPFRIFAACPADLLVLSSSFGGAVGLKTNNPQATLDCNGDAIFAAPIRLPLYTVSTLPSASTYANRLAYATNGRAAGEGPGAGTGCVVRSNGTNWRTIYDNTTVAS